MLTISWYFGPYGNIINILITKIEFNIVMLVWLPQFSASVSASASMKIVVVRFVDADPALIAGADFFGDRRENAVFRRYRRQWNVQEFIKKLTPTQPQVAASTKRTALISSMAKLLRYQLFIPSLSRGSPRVPQHLRQFCTLHNSKIFKIRVAYKLDLLSVSQPTL